MSESFLQVTCVYPPMDKTVRVVAVLIFIVAVVVIAADRGYDGAAIGSILFAGAALLQATLSTGGASPLQATQ